MNNAVALLAEKVRANLIEQAIDDFACNDDKELFFRVTEIIMNMQNDELMELFVKRVDYDLSNVMAGAIKDIYANVDLPF